MAVTCDSVIECNENATKWVEYREFPGSHSHCLLVIVVVKTEMYCGDRVASSSKLPVSANPG